MSATMTHRGDRGPGAYSPYLGWSHRNSRLEMMELPDYLDSIQQGYGALRDAYGTIFGTFPGLLPSTAVSGQPQPVGHRPDCGCGRGRGREHSHGGGCDCTDLREHHGHGCGPEPSCRCTCCIEDADIVVYAHCGELRVVPIQIDNDTRRVRDEVSLEISDVRTAGGRVLPWQAAATVKGPLTLDACSTTTIEIVVRVACNDNSNDNSDGNGEEVDDKGDVDSAKGTKGNGKAASEAGRQTIDARIGTRFGNVDECVVGYFSVRLGGCLNRPIVVAIAALPAECDSYRADCASCC